MGRLVHLFVRLAAALVAIVVVLAAALSMRLAAGPISLGLFAPSAARLLESVIPYRVDIGDLDVLWRDWRQGLLLRIEHLRLTASQGQERAHIDDVTVGFSARAMAQGVIAPTFIRAERAELRLDRSQLSEPEGGGKEGPNELLRGFRGPPDADHPLSFLQTIMLRDIVIGVAESAGGSPSPDKDWNLLVRRAEFTREDGRRLTGDAAVTLERGADRADVSLVAASSNDGALQLSFTLGEFRPAAFAGLDTALSPLITVDVPLQGGGAVRIDEKGELLSAALDLTGSSGALNLDGPAARAIGLTSPERLNVQNLSLRASFDATPTRLVVEKLDIAFAPNTAVYLPVPVDHRFPLAGLSVAAVYQDSRLVVSSLDLDLNGLRLAVAATIDSLQTAPSGQVKISSQNVRVNDFARYWPRSLAPGAWEWCTTRLRDGVVPRLDALFAFESRNRTTEVTAASATFNVEALTVDYLPPLPPTRRTSGTITADMSSLRIDIDSGEASGLSVGDGFIRISGLDGAFQTIDVNVLVDGPVRSAMTLLASPPLEYPQRIGVRPEQTSGETKSRLRLRFPLLADLDADEMEVDADVQLERFGVIDLVKGVDVAEGQARLHIEGSGMRAEGSLAVAGVNGDFRLSTSFLEGVDPQASVQFNAEDVPLDHVRRELRDVFDLDRYLVGGTFSGRVGFELSSTDVGVVTTSLDLAPASLAIPEIGWRKPAGIAGVADATLVTQQDRLVSIRDVTLLTPGLDVGGALTLGGDGEVDAIEIHRLIAGKTNLSGTVALLADGRWDIGLSGIGLDLTPLMTHGKSEPGPPGGAGRSTADHLPDFSLTADFETLWLDSADPIRALQATVVHEAERWALVQMQGHLSDGSAVTMSIAPDDKRGRAVRVEAENAGEALRAFGVIADVQGGVLEAKGRFDDADPARPLVGRVKVHDFHVVNAPILARLLSILAVGGIRDALTGRGIAFRTFDMPFRLREENLEIIDGRAFGWSLGITFGGAVDIGTEIVDVSGRLVPFYAINSALGRLPVIGPVMTGGDRGGGVFSAGYQVAGPLTDPVVSVNPASVLFPGFLRWLLEALSGWVGGSNSNLDAELLPP